MVTTRVFAVLLLGLAACTDGSGPSHVEEFFTASLAKWLATGPASYQMVLSRSCDCATGTEIVQVVVRNKVVESRTYLPGGDPVPAGRAADFPDVPGLFGLIRKAIDQDAYTHSETYDATDGYPTAIFVDWVPSSTTDNVTYGTSAFQPIP
jgi:hypothetical protein